MSIPVCVAPLPADGEVGVLCVWVSLVVVVVVVVTGCRRDDAEIFVFDAGNGFGAANLERSFVTFV
jgi:hypothetical protein